MAIKVPPKSAEETPPVAPVFNASGASREVHPLAHLAGKYAGEPLWEEWLEATREERQRIEDQERQRLDEAESAAE